MMKRFLTTALLLLATIGITQAQGIGVGLKAGMNFANQNIETIQQLSVDGRTGFHAGAYVHIALPGGLGIQPEAYFSTQQTEFSDINFTSENTYRYLQVPVLLRFNFLFLNVHAGPQFGILLDAETSINSVSQSFKDDLKNQDVGLVIGVGANLPLNLNVTARYVHGMTDINDSANFEEIKNNMVQISLGYRLFGNK